MIKYHIYCAEKFLLKNPFFMFFANLSFVVSHLKINPAVHLNIFETLIHCSQKEKFIKSLLALNILMF